MAKTRKSRDISSRELMASVMPPRGHIEVRERKDYSWSVFYPDEGWIPCPGVCNVKQAIKSHKCDREQGWIESSYKPTDKDDAMDWATYLAEEREVKVISFKGIRKKNA